MTTPHLVFDFDGTVALGDGPVRAYARATADQVGTAVAADFLGALRQEWDAPRAEALDRYDLVRLLAGEHGIGPDALSAGYLASRASLATDTATITAPAGLAGFLAEARARGARPVLATNAPGIRIPEALIALGLADAFDELHTGVGKPRGLDGLLQGWLELGPVLSFGDIWANDLAPVTARGGATVLVAPDGQSPADAAPDLVVPRLEDAYDYALDWLDAARRAA